MFRSPADMQTRQGKRQAPDSPGPRTPHGPEHQPRLHGPPTPLLALPGELETLYLRSLEYKDLCRLGSTCGALRVAAEDDGLWRREFERQYGEAGPLQEVAAARAGGWKRLFAARHEALREADPWLKPSVHEVAASVEALVALPPPLPQHADHADSKASAAPGSSAAKAAPSAASQQPPREAAVAAVAPALLEQVQQQKPAEAAHGQEQLGQVQQEIEAEQEAELCLVFLVDGSGSVTEEDFRVMTDFMLGAVRALAGAPHGLRSRVAVVQFSNDVRVEQGPAAVDVAQFEALIGNMHRMNGGTNIALAVQKAGQLLKPLGPRTHRVLALLTDGRIDSHQSREAAEMASRLGDEQACVRVHAYGVGRGVDKEELLRIIGGREPETAADRYLGLMVLDEAPW